VVIYDVILFSASKPWTHKCDLSKYALLTEQTKVDTRLKLVRAAYLRTNMIIH
jgi:hypothetical protein